MIDINTQLHQTITLTITFLNPTGEANMYVWFGYVQKKICNNTRVKVSVSIKYDMINTNKQVNNKWRYYRN